MSLQIELIFALRDAAPQVWKEYCSPFGDLMDSAGDALEDQAKEIESLRMQIVELTRQFEEATEERDSANQRGDIFKEKTIKRTRQLAELTEWNDQIGCTNYELRKELAECRAEAFEQAAQIEMMRRGFKDIIQTAKQSVISYGYDKAHTRNIDTANGALTLSTTPPQALEAFAAKVREQCAQACNDAVASIEGELCAEAIRNLKEIPNETQTVPASLD